jgi:tyrosinase
MKIIKTVILAGMVACAIVFVTPALSHIVEHHEYKQASNPMLNNGSNTVSAFHYHNAIHSSTDADSALAPANSKRPIWKNKAYGAIVRKNVVDLTPQEKQAFVNAVRALKNIVPRGSRTNIYDQFVAVHVGAMGLMYDDAQGPAAGHDGAHESAILLPWHRELVYRFEKALQSVNPNVTIPYWDWTDPKALEVIFSDDFMGPNGQGVTLNIPIIEGGSMSLGDGQQPNFNLPGSGNEGGSDMSLGDGQQANPNIQTVSVQGGPVQSGPFSAASGWTVNPDLHFKSSSRETFGNQILRFLQVPPTNSYPVPKEDIEQVLAIDNYETFRPALEGFIKVDSSTGQQTPGVYLHNYFHSLVGGGTFDPAVGRPEALGTMTDLTTSINDPVFWLVHSNVDRLWAEWQASGHEGSDYYPAVGGHYGENLNDRMWPWDGGESTPANGGPGDSLSLLPVFSANDIVTPRDTLDFRKYRYTYDTLIFPVRKPTWKINSH